MACQNRIAPIHRSAGFRCAVTSSAIAVSSASVLSPASCETSAAALSAAIRQTAKVPFRWGPVAVRPFSLVGCAPSRFEHVLTLVHDLPPRRVPQSKVPVYDVVAWAYGGRHRVSGPGADLHRVQSSGGNHAVARVRPAK